MVSIDEIHSEIQLGQSGTGSGEQTESNEVRIEELREIVRQLLAEEYERVLRSAHCDEDWAR